MLKAFLEAVILFLPIAPFVNLYRFSGFLRRLSLFPRQFWGLSFSILMYLAFSALLVWSFPRYSFLGILLATPLGVYFFYWRARPTFGSRRGLPPGSLQLAPSGPWIDYLYYQKQADKYGPVFKMNNFVQPMICLAGIQLGNTFLKNHEDSTSTPPMPFNRYIPNGFMRYMAPAVHMEYRSKMKGMFSDSTFLEERAECLEKIIGNTLLRMADDSKAIHPGPHLQSMTFSIFANLFLGISPDDPKFRHLQNSYKKIDYRHALFSSHSKVEQE